jgi:hypothetical protein
VAFDNNAEYDAKLMRLILVTFLRRMFSVVLIIFGAVICLFSIAVAGGWGRRPLSIIGIIIAMLGLVFMLWGYWLVRGSEWAPMAAACVTITLGLGSTLLVIGLLTLFLPNESTPTGYLIAVGSVCVLAFYKFRAYLKNA